MACGAATLLVMVLAIGALIPGQKGVWACYGLALIVVPWVGGRVYMRAARRAHGDGLGTGTVVTLMATLIPSVVLIATQSTTPVALLSLALFPLLALGLQPWNFEPSHANLDRRAPLMIALLMVLAFQMTISGVRVPSSWSEWLVGLMLIATCTALTIIRWRALGRRVGLLVDALACLAIALSVISIRTILNELARFNIDFYLGAANDVVHGRTVLVDTASQYGVGVIYFLAALIGFTGTYRAYAVCLTAITVITAAMCVSAYVIGRRLGMGRPLAGAATIVVLSTTVYGTDLYFYDYPSTGSLRFVWPILMVLWISLGTGRNSHHIAEALQLATLAVATVWSAETFVYTAAIYSTSAIATALESDRSSFLALARGCRWSLLKGCLSSALAILVLVLYTLLRSGQLPNPNLYLSYLQLYTVGDFSSLGARVWTPWELVATPILVSLGALIVRWSRPAETVSGDGAGHAVRLASLTIFGIVEYSYFAARMAPSNLRDVAVPSILLTFYGISLARTRLTPIGSRRVNALVGLVVVSYLLTAAPDNAAMAGNALLPSTLGAVVGTGSASPQLWLTDTTAYQNTTEAQVVALIDARSWPERIPMAVSTDAQTRALLQTGHANWFPVPDPCEAGLERDSYPTAQSAVASLHAGQWVIVSERTRDLSVLSHYYVALISRHFMIAKTEGGTDGIVALRLGGETSTRTWRDVPPDTQSADASSGC